MSRVACDVPTFVGTGRESLDLKGCADVVYDSSDLGAAVSSGSLKSRGMVVVPRALGVLAPIASDDTTNLVLERRTCAWRSDGNWCSSRMRHL